MMIYPGNDRYIAIGNDHRNSGYSLVDLSTAMLNFQRIMDLNARYSLVNVYIMENPPVVAG